MNDSDNDGGDAVCWLDRVCPECGALAESKGDICWRCGGSTLRLEARVDGEGDRPRP